MGATPMDELKPRKLKRLPDKYFPDCIYANGVMCADDKWCFQCGWNPEVAAQRAQKVRAKINEQ